MKVQHNFMAKSLGLILISLGCCQLVSGQGFKGIIPLESTCEDVKRILQIDDCNSPRNTYWLKDFTISISFTKDKPSPNDKFCYKVPAGRVISLTVLYNKPFPIKEFEYKLKYAEGPFGDIDTVSYENEEKGVSVFTNLGRINTAIFLPTPKQHKKLAFRCNTAIK